MGKKSSGVAICSHPDMELAPVRVSSLNNPKFDSCAGRWSVKLHIKRNVIKFNNTCSNTKLCLKSQYYLLQCV